MTREAKAEAQHADQEGPFRNCLQPELEENVQSYLAPNLSSALFIYLKEGRLLTGRTELG